MTDHLTTQEFWDEKYNTKERIWSGKVNTTLEKYTKDLTPGTALDLGCGEGGDTIWLAKKGWTVTAVDISTVALERAQQIAIEQNLADKIVFEQHDLTQSFPIGQYDLVSAHFLQSPIEFDRAHILKKAANAVAIGGHLLIVEHAKAPSWSDHQHDSFPSAKETFESIGLPQTLKIFETIECGEFERQGFSPDNEPATLYDNIIMVKRKG